MSKNFIATYQENCMIFGIKEVPKIKYALNRLIKKGKDKVDKKYQVNLEHKFNCNDCDLHICQRKYKNYRGKSA